MSTIPPNHPRYVSLMIREKIAQGMKKGIVHETGLIAHGRGEAFDYLLGEETIDGADRAEKVAAAVLLCARHPVISVNGNVVALVSTDCIRLSKEIPALLEVNLFHRTPQRMERCAKELRDSGADQVLGLQADAVIPGLDHDRARCEKEGIFSADVVLVPLEDGDRCQALCDMGKTVIVIDLNPLSRTAKTANITIVDNVVRAIPRIGWWITRLKEEKRSVVTDCIDSWDNEKNLAEVVSFISKRLNSLY